jgi:hypothetical protein
MTRNWRLVSVASNTLDSRKIAKTFFNRTLIEGMLDQLQVRERSLRQISSAAMKALLLKSIYGLLTILAFFAVVNPLRFPIYIDAVGRGYDHFYYFIGRLYGRLKSL